MFINGQLAVDLGAIHTPVSGSVTFGAGARTNFGLTNGQVYEVAVFQAERQTTCSTFRLTLSGFNSAPSQCTPTCGDGIVSIGEECDDGKDKNTGAYGGCTADCKLGPYCGDGIVQPDFEDCDDGGKIVLEGRLPVRLPAPGDQLAHSAYPPVNACALLPMRAPGGSCLRKRMLPPPSTRLSQTMACRRSSTTVRT